MHVYGYEVGLIRAIRMLLVRAFCRHEDLEITAATCASQFSRLNIQIGTVIRCNRCKKAWVRELIAGGELKK